MNATQELIDALIAAHLAGKRFEPKPTPLSRAEVLAIQSAVCKALGKVAGFKVGRGADEAPILAPVLSRYVVETGGRCAAKDKIGVELEVGFEVIRPLPDGAFPDQPSAYFKPCVALELVDTRIGGSLAQDPQFKFADFQINAGVVTGDVLAEWDGSDFGDLPIKLTAGDEVVVDGMAQVPGGSALDNLELLVAHLGDHCGGLQVGQVVITGSLCGLPYFGPGTEIEGVIEGLGRVSVRIE